VDVNAAKDRSHREHGAHREEFLDLNFVISAISVVKHCDATTAE
jgi:hypothetical protein